MDFFGRHSFRAAGNRRGFTLIEVLVVVAILALLISILVPSLKNAREQAKTAVCTTQLQQLMRAALFYKTDYREYMPGAGVNDHQYKSQFDAGTRKDWLSWLGTWAVLLSETDIKGNPPAPAWVNAPRGGRLWKYYRDEKLLKCPSAQNYNGKFSYSMPENVAMAMKDSSNKRNGLPPKMDKVKHTSDAILFLDEDEENGLTTYSMDDGFGEPDLFADRHLGRASVAFFDGHANAYYFPRGPGRRTSPNVPKVRYARNKSTNPFEAWMIQIAPFNSRSTPQPWNWNGNYQDLPKFRRDANYPGSPCRSPGPGCE